MMECGCGEPTDVFLVVNIPSIQEEEIRMPTCKPCMLKAEDVFNQFVDEEWLDGDQDAFYLEVTFANDDTTPATCDGGV